MGYVRNDDELNDSGMITRIGTIRNSRIRIDTETSPKRASFSAGDA